MPGTVVFVKNLDAEDARIWTSSGHFVMYEDSFHQPGRAGVAASLIGLPNLLPIFTKLKPDALFSSGDCQFVIADIIAPFERARKMLVKNKVVFMPQGMIGTERQWTKAANIFNEIDFQRKQTIKTAGRTFTMDDWRARGVAETAFLL